MSSSRTRDKARVSKGMPVHSVIVPANSTRLLLFTKPNGTILEGKRDQIRGSRLSTTGDPEWTQYSSNTLRPHHRYTIHIRALSDSQSTGARWSHAPNNDWQMDVGSEPTTYSGSCDNDCLCTAQLPPSEPQSLFSKWHSRQTASVRWIEPETLNGRLVGYRLTIKRICSSSQTDTSEYHGVRGLN